MAEGFGQGLQPKGAFMFGNFKQMAALLGNAGEIKRRFEQVQAELAKRTIEGEAGAGAVRITMNGKMEVLRVRIDRGMLGALTGVGTATDAELAEALVAAAMNDALDKAKRLIQAEASAAAGGLDLPGLSGMLGG
jgi:DNA-binding YbaB/EbfC family protein